MRIFFKRFNFPGMDDFPEIKPNKHFLSTKMALLLIGAILAFYALSFYVALFPINLHSKQFYFYAVFFILSVSIILRLTKKFVKIAKYAFLLSIFMSVLFVAFEIFSIPLFRSADYAKLLTITDGDFISEVPEADFNTLPIVDRVTAIKLGARKMGEMGNLVSQYDIDETYSQINISGKPVRVTPLYYSGFIKWLNNVKSGIPYYISIDMTNQNASLVKPPGNIKYSASDKFGRNIVRHIRFNYPTKIIGEINFEIDDENHPYYVASVIKPTIGFFEGMDVKEVITVDAIDGKCTLYSANDAPAWIDRVYPAEMIIKQLTDHGKYQKGFLNSVLAQEGVTAPTKGYNYLSIGKDIILYTGITSVLSDESNIGFIFCNLRTKETKFYPVSSAAEFSVMDSAAGAVQEKGYKATFPILINLNGRPTYFMALKDNAELTKMFALVDAQNYQNAAVASTVEQTVANYKNSYLKMSEDTPSSDTAEFTVKEIQSAVVDGNTHYFITSEEDDTIYIISVKTDNTLPFIKLNDEIHVKGHKTDKQFIVTNIIH